MAQDKKTDAARGVVKQEKDSITFDSWEHTSNFLARQIVDDLFRAGLDARYYQHIVERTLLNWPGSGRRSWGWKMTEFFVVANSNPAPFVGDTSMDFIQGRGAREALEEFVRAYSHPCGLWSAKIYTSSDTYHKPLASWMANAALAQSDPGGGQIVEG